MNNSTKAVTATYTENELKMLKAFKETSMECCDACEEEHNMSYMNANDLQEELGGNKQSIGGTMASLIEKGAISDCGESYRGSRLNDFVICDFDFDS